MTTETAPVRSSWSNTTVMGLAAVVAALIAMLGENDAFTPLSIAMSLVGLVPWALIAGGLRVPMPVALCSALVTSGVMVIVDGNPGGIFPALVTLVWATRALGSSWVTYLATATTISFIVVHAIQIDSAHEAGLIYFIGGAGISAFAGTMLRRQDQLVEELQAARSIEAEHAAATERTRIAREVHDVVAHSLTVVMLHVTGAKRAISSNPTGATEALTRAETVGRDSLASIRQMVGLLRSNDGADSHGPLPTLADIPALVTQYREAGLQIDTDFGALTAPADVCADPGIELAAFRVIQEALANVLQHAPGQGCTVQLGRDPEADRLLVVVENVLGDNHPSNSHLHNSHLNDNRRNDYPRNDFQRNDSGPNEIHASDGGVVDSGSTARRGLGLLGMHERARAAGGSVETGPTPRRTWLVAATLPLHPVTASMP